MKANNKISAAISAIEGFKVPPPPELIDLGNLDAAEPPAHKVDALIPAGAVTLLAAHGGAGKTLLALLLAICLATGRAFLGKSVQRSRVIVYSAEDGRQAIMHRLLRLLDHLGIAAAELDGWLFVYDMTETDPVLYREDRSGAGTTDRYDWLRDRIEEHGASVVIVDNCSDVYDANEISRPRVREFLRLLVRLVKPQHGAVLLLSHVDKNTAKGNGDDDQDYSGSTAWNNSVRSRLSLSEKHGVVTLKHRKSNYGKKADPIELHWQDGLLVESAGASVAAPLIEFERMRAVLRIIGDFNARGENINTGVSGPGNTFSLLHCEPGYPSRMPRDKFYAVLRDAERQGLIEREEYRSVDRHPKVRWVLTAKGRVECHAHAPGIDGAPA